MKRLSEALPNTAGIRVSVDARQSMSLHGSTARDGAMITPLQPFQQGELTAAKITAMTSGAQQLKRKIFWIEKIYKDNHGQNGEYLGQTTVSVERMNNDDCPKFLHESVELNRPAPEKLIVWLLSGLALHKRFDGGDAARATVLSDIAAHLGGSPIGALLLAIDFFKFEDEKPWFPATGAFCNRVKAEAEKLERIYLAAHAVKIPKMRPAPVREEPKTREDDSSPLERLDLAFKLIKLLGMNTERAQEYFTAYADVSELSKITDADYNSTLEAAIEYTKIK